LSCDQFSNGLQVGYDEATMERQHADTTEIRRLLSYARAAVDDLTRTFDAIEDEASGRLLD
jgi:hypothetical protein